MEPRAKVLDSLPISTLGSLGTVLTFPDSIVPLFRHFPLEEQFHSPICSTAGASVHIFFSFCLLQIAMIVPQKKEAAISIAYDAGSNGLCATYVL